MKSKYFSMLFTTLMIFGFCGTAFSHTDDFSGSELNGMWTVRDPAGNSTYKVEGGKLTLNLPAGSDMYKKGMDKGVMFLTDPPPVEDFSMEILVNVTVGVNQPPPACHVGLVLFREDTWAYSAWAPYASTDVRLEDCIDQDYRWRDQTQIGVDAVGDGDTYLKIIKTGTQLEFLWKDNAGDDWQSAGVDEKLGPQYEIGTYQVGLIAKSWSGSVDSVFEFDYFDLPELTPVQPAGKLTTTWSEIKIH